MAQTGMALARAEVEAALALPSSPLYKKIVEDSAGWADETPLLASELDLRSAYPAQLDEVAAMWRGTCDDVRTLKARVFVRRGTALTPPMHGNHAMGSRQKTGQIFIEVSCKFGGARFLSSDASIEEKLLGYYEFKAVSPLLPSINHFTMFLSDPMQPGANPGWINDSLTDYTGLVTDSRGALLLLNGQGSNVDHLAPMLNHDFFKGQGWTYMGNKEELVLNLAFSADEQFRDNRQIGEDFMFYRKPKPGINRRARRAYAHKDANKKLTELLGNDSREIRFWEMGVTDLNQKYLDVYGKALPNPSASDPFRKLKASVLHLQGRPPWGVNPSLVFGRVKAGFLRIASAFPKRETDPAMAKAMTTCLPSVADGGFAAAQLRQEIDKALDDAPDVTALGDASHFYTLGKFLFMSRASASDPARHGLTLAPETAPRVPFSLYREIMSNWVTRPYNQGLLYILSQNIEPEPMRAAALRSALGLPDSLFEANDSPAAATVSVPDDLLPAQDPLGGGGGAPGTTLDKIAQTLKSPATVQAVEDDLATRTASPKATDFKKFLEDQHYLANGTLDLGAIVVWPKGVPCVMPPIAKIRRGGAVYADSFVISEDLGTDIESDDTQPLMLFAREEGPPPRSTSPRTGTSGRFSWLRTGSSRPTTAFTWSAR